MAKSFNNDWINNFRSMSILRMLKEIRRMILIQIHWRYEQVVVWQDEPSPLIRRKVLKRREGLKTLSVIFGHNDT